jgi:hypothetical protein
VNPATIGRSGIWLESACDDPDEAENEDEIGKSVARLTPLNAK